MSKAKARNDYARRNYDRILFQFPAGSRERLRAAAAAAGYASVNAWAAAVLGAAAGDDFSLPGEFGPRKARAAAVLGAAAGDDFSLPGEFGPRKARAAGDGAGPGPVEK